MMLDPHVECDEMRATPWAVGLDGRSSERRAYRPPVLSALGDVRDVTLGGSPGMGDTQNPMTEGNIPFYGDYIIVP
jgi:hypothetical protein